MNEEFDDQPQTPESEPEPDYGPTTPGARLRAAREAKGMSLAQVAAETRIREQHLELIENNGFDQLPGRTYAVGFAKNFARSVGLDQAMIAEEVRADLDSRAPEERTVHPSIEPGDPARTPSSRLGWMMAFAILLLGVGGYAFYSAYLTPGAELESLTEQERRAQAEAEAARAGEGGVEASDAAASGPVVLTAREDEIWVRIYDGTEDTVLMEKILSNGERYAVPASATDPQIRTGRPDALSITIGGRAAGRLAPDDFVMSGQSLTAQGLAARGADEADDVDTEDAGDAAPAV